MTKANDFEKKFNVWIIEDEHTPAYVDSFRNLLGDAVNFFCTYSYLESIKFPQFLAKKIKENRIFSKFIPDFVIVDLKIPEEIILDENHYKRNEDYLSNEIYQDYQAFKEIDPPNKPTRHPDGKYIDGGIYAYSLLFELRKYKFFKGALLSAHGEKVSELKFLTNAGFIEFAEKIGDFKNDNDIKKKDSYYDENDRILNKEIPMYLVNINPNITYNTLINEIYFEYLDEENGQKEEIRGKDKIKKSPIFQKKRLKALSQNKELLFREEADSIRKNPDRTNERFVYIFEKSFKDFREMETNHLDFFNFHQTLREYKTSKMTIEELKDQNIYSKNGVYFFKAGCLFAYEFQRYQREDEIDELIEKIQKILPIINLSIDFSMAYNNEYIRYLTHGMGVPSINMGTNNEDGRAKIVTITKSNLENLTKKLTEIDPIFLKWEIVKANNMINAISNGLKKTELTLPALENVYLKLKDEIDSKPEKRYDCLEYEIAIYIKSNSINSNKHIIKSLELLRKQGLLRSQDFGIACPLNLNMENIDKCISGRNQFSEPGVGLCNLKDYLSNICVPMSESYKYIGENVIILKDYNKQSEIFFNFFWMYRESIKNMIERDRNVVGDAKYHFLLFENMKTCHNIQKNYICFLSDGAPFDLSKVGDNNIRDSFIKNKLEYFGDFFIFSPVSNENEWQGKSIFSESPERELEAKFISENVLRNIQVKLIEQIKQFENEKKTGILKEIVTKKYEIKIRKAFIIKFESIKEEVADENSVG